MSLFGTLGKYVGLQAEEAESGVHSLLAKLDSEGYSEAIIRQMEAEHLKAAQELAKVKREFQRENKEAEDAKAAHNRKLEAAQAMQADLETDPSNAGLQAAFDKLVESLQQSQTVVQTEVAEAEAAKALLDAVQQEVDSYAEGLRTARSRMKNAAADKKLAETQLRTAERKAEAAKRSSGAATRLGTLSAGLAAFNKDAEAAKAKAEALNMQADLNTVPNVEDDALVAKYMSGGASAATPSNSDKLAGLGV